MKSSTARSIAAGGFCFALLLNLVEAVWDPDATAWTATRALAGTVFTVGLLLWLWSFLVERRERGERA
jgi:hypothetical protein